MSSFDLNIANYKKPELEDMFELPVGGVYDSFLVEKKVLQLRTNVASDQSIEEDIRKKTLHFLEEAKNSLLSGINSSHFVQKIGNAYNVNHDLQKSAVIEAGNTYVIDRPNTAFANSYPGEYFPGVINPLKKRTTRQNVNIDTRFRSNYYGSLSTNFQLDLPIKFSNVMQIQLAAFEIPSSYYVISKQAGNNFFNLIFYTQDQPNPYLITVPDGNYTAAGLVSYLNYTVSQDISGVQFIYNIDPSGNGSGQMIISYTGEFILNFQAGLDGNPDMSTPLPLKLGWLMGFRNGIYDGNKNYVSEGIVDLSGQKYLYLVVDDYNNNVNNSFYSAFNSSVLNKNILARISFQPSPFGTVSQNNLSVITTPRQYFGPVDIQKMHIQLLDEYGRIIELNNMDYSFCLTFVSVYDI